MSICIEQNNFKNNQFSQSFPACDGSLSSHRADSKKQGFIKQLKIWISRSHQRKNLVALDKRMLDDIGYTEAQARVEFSKPFWK